MKIEKNSTLIMIGDSVTDCGRLQPQGEGDWGNGYVNLVHGYLSAFYIESKIRVINKGISGQQSKDLVVRWEEDVLSYKPKWVSILIGINDVWRHFDNPLVTEIHGSIEVYEKSLIKMIEDTLPVTSNILLMTPYMIEGNKEDSMRKMMDEYGTVCKNLAKQYNLICVDLQEKFDERLKHVHPMMFGWDRIHPNIIGHTIIADAFLEAVGAK